VALRDADSRRRLPERVPATARAATFTKDAAACHKTAVRGNNRGRRRHDAIVVGACEAAIVVDDHRPVAVGRGGPAFEHTASVALPNHHWQGRSALPMGPRIGPANGAADRPCQWGRGSALKRAVGDLPDLHRHHGYRSGIERAERHGRALASTTVRLLSPLRITCAWSVKEVRRAGHCSQEQPPLQPRSPTLVGPAIETGACGPWKICGRSVCGGVHRENGLG